MNEQYNHLMFEYLNPVQIQEALVKSPILYVPMGTYEWHGYHLPVGNDAVKAYGLCLRAAERTGGLVLPPFYYGTTGHIGYPMTVLVDENLIIELMNATFREMVKWGVKKAVMFTGHFSGEQVEMVKKIAGSWDDPNMKVLGLSDYMVPNPPYHPDHAATFETSILHAMDPGLVHLENLPDINTAPANDPDGNTWGKHRHNTDHPLYGIFGEDPRTMSPEKGEELLQKAVNWLAETVEKA